MIISNNGQSRSLVDKKKLIKSINSEYSRLSPEEKKIADNIMINMYSGTKERLDSASELMALSYAMEYKRVPVSPEIFYTSEYYLGQVAEDIYPQLRRDVIEFMKGNYNEAIITGGLGWGKTFWASLVIPYIVYIISTLKDPAKSFGVASGTKLTIAMLSVDEKTAVDVMFSEIISKVASSVYFKDEYSYRMTQKKIVFGNPRKGESVVYVVPRSNTDNSVIGLTVVAAIVDEINFIKTTKSSRDKAKASGRQIITRQGQIYSTLKKRISSRFAGQDGMGIGKLLLLSSKLSNEDFTSKRIRESEYDESVYVRDYSNWELKEFKGNYPKKSFFVLVGSGNIKSKILKGKDLELMDIEGTIREGGEILQVPADPDLYSAFVSDTEGAIADMGGRVSTPSSRFLKDVRMVDRIFNKKLPVPYRKVSKVMYKSKGVVKSISLVKSKRDPNINEDPSFFYNEVYVSGSNHNKFDFRNLCKKQDMASGGFIWKPLINPRAVRFVHIDASLNTDNTGLAMGHIARIETREVREGDHTVYEQVPLIVIDLAVAIAPPLNGEIQYEELRRMIYSLKDIYNFDITHVSMDSVEKGSNLQLFRERGIDTSYISVDKTPFGYGVIKDMIKEGRITIHHSDLLREELLRLEQDPLTFKVDHPSDGSKDIADAVTSVAYNLFKALAINLNKNNNHKKGIRLTNNNDSSYDLMKYIYGEGREEEEDDYDLFNTKTDLEKLFAGDEVSLEALTKLTKVKDKELIDFGEGKFFPEYDAVLEADITKTPFDVNKKNIKKEVDD